MGWFHGKSQSNKWMKTRATPHLWTPPYRTTMVLVRPGMPWMVFGAGENPAVENPGDDLTRVAPKIRTPLCSCWTHAGSQLCFFNHLVVKREFPLQNPFIPKHRTLPYPWSWSCFNAPKMFHLRPHLARVNSSSWLQDRKQPVKCRWPEIGVPLNHAPHYDFPITQPSSYWGYWGPLW